MAGKCEYYRSNKKVNYARGFVCTTEALAVSCILSSCEQVITSYEQTAVPSAGECISPYEGTAVSFHCYLVYLKW